MESKPDYNGNGEDSEDTNELECKDRKHSVFIDPSISGLSR